MSTILDKAAEITSGAREESYGHPREDFARTAKMWSAVLGVTLTAEQVGICMILVKVSRLCHSITEDTLTDIAGYARTIERLGDFVPSNQWIDEEKKQIEETQSLREKKFDRLKSICGQMPPALREAILNGAYSTYAVNEISMREEEERAKLEHRFDKKRRLRIFELLQTHNLEGFRSMELSVDDYLWVAYHFRSPREQGLLIGRVRLGVPKEIEAFVEKEQEEIAKRFREENDIGQHPCRPFASTGGKDTRPAARAKKGKRS